MVEVKLAGYNCDAEPLEELRNSLAWPGVTLTPETLSAAYARISRDPRPIAELRAEARREVEKARKSNRNIIFGMGHASVAEHASFSFDIENISRLAIEKLEWHRLCSYTEKSQRYIKLDDDFYMPTELRASPFEEQLLDLHIRSVELYNEAYPKLTEWFKKACSEKSAKQCEGHAKEDARYAMLLCTTGQLGMTCSARNLELITRRCASSSLGEVRRLGSELLRKAKEIAPSLVRYTKGTLYDRNFDSQLSTYTDRVMEARGLEFSPHDFTAEAKLCMVYGTPDFCIDDYIGVALLHRISPQIPYIGVWDIWKEWTKEDKFEFFKVVLQDMELYDAAPREFEHGILSFECIVSASCYAQLKRHRMCTQTCQGYDVFLAPVVPESIEGAGLSDVYLELAADAAHLYKEIRREFSEDTASYVLLNGHRRRVLVTLNMRELYHISRMRQDGHAQWEIRHIADEMVRLSRAYAPLSGMLLAGKDKFVDKVGEVYGVGHAERKER